MKRLLVASLAGLLTFSLEARAEWVVSAYTGVSHTFPTDLRVRQSSTGSDATFDGVSWAPHPFTQGAPYYGLRLSYFPSDSLHAGTMIDFTHYKMYAETADELHVHGTWNGVAVNEVTSLGARVQRLQVSHGVNLTSLDAEYRWGSTLAQGTWETHAGGGLLVYLPHSEGTIDQVGVSNDYQYGGVGGQIFGGTEYGLSRHIALSMEGKFDAGSLDLTLDPSTRIDLQVRTAHLIGGVAFHF
jgi:hypothetical protein